MLKYLSLDSINTLEVQPIGMSAAWIPGPRVRPRLWNPVFSDICVVNSSGEEADAIKLRAVVMKASKSHKNMFNEMIHISGTNIRAYCNFFNFDNIPEAIPAIILDNTII